MKRVVCKGRGGPEVLQAIAMEELHPSKRGVVVRVEASGVAYGDVMRRQGLMAPMWDFTPGYDNVGIVERVGDKADRTLLGARVGVLMPFPGIGIGGYASHIKAEAKDCIRVPDNVGPSTAIGLGLNYITARQILVMMLDLKPGQRVLVHGAAGGVGTAVLELGRIMGLKVYGTASQKKHTLVTNLGGIPIDYQNEDFVKTMNSLEPDGVDAVLDPIGGDNLRRSAQVLKPSGKLIIYGISGIMEQGGGLARAALHMAKVAFSARLRTYNFGLPPFCLQKAREDWTLLLQEAAEGRLQPQIGAEVPFDEVQRAHELMDSKQVHGKIILVH